MFDSQKLSEFLTRAIYQEFNLAKPSQNDDGSLSFSPDSSRRIEVIYNQSDAENSFVNIMLRANTNCDPVHALQNLAVIQYMRQQLKDRFFIDAEIASYGVDNSSGVSHYQIIVPITDEEMGNKFIEFLKEMNPLVYIDENNCMWLFERVISELLYDRW